jgi:hypothetical protein
MHILIVEDRGSVGFFLQNALERRGHRVSVAFLIRDADSVWGNRAQVPVDCIVCDLNLPPEGLSSLELKGSRGGLLSGWLWLHGHVLRNSPEMARRAAVYSNYLPELRDLVRSEEYAGVRLIDKGRGTDSISQVLQFIGEVESALGEMERRPCE